MHNEIKNFYLTGVINAGLFVETRNRLIVNLESDMRDEGYVPVLDLTQQFSREYDVDSEQFTFELTIYGAYVGRDEAWVTSGWTNGKLVPGFIRNVK